MFAKRELHFNRLSLVRCPFFIRPSFQSWWYKQVQQQYASGEMSFSEFSVKSRDSIEALKKIDSQKKIMAAPCSTL